MSNCTGNFQVYRGELNYTVDRPQVIYAQLVNVRQLTSLPADYGYARMSRDGTQIAFASKREEHWDIYVVNTSDGGGERRLTVSPGDSETPTWSADVKTIAFASNRGGSWQIYTVDVANTALVTQLTDNPGESRGPLWAQ